MRFLTLAVLFLGLALSGYARAGDTTTSASMILAQHGLAGHVELAQAAGCANTCQVAESLGGATCPIPTATGTTCIPVGTGCNCNAQLVGNGMGNVVGTAVRK